jgi:hypothetical protein
VAGRARGRGAKPKTKRTRRSKPSEPPAQPQPALETLDIPRPLAVRLLGVSDRTFTRLESEGVFRAKEAGAGGRQSVYDAPAMVASYIAHVERKLTGSNDTPRDRRDRSQAELNELRLARERGELLPRDQVVREGQAFVKATMAKLRALAPRLVRAGLIKRTDEGAVAALVREAQEEMSRWQNLTDLQAAVADPAA